MQVEERTKNPAALKISKRRDGEGTASYERGVIYIDEIDSVTSSSERCDSSGEDEESIERFGLSPLNVPQSNRLVPHRT